jgi:hypothetical protein
MFTHTYFVCWDIELIIDESVDGVKRNPKFKCALFLLIPTSSVEGRDTCMDLENFYVTPCFSHDEHLVLVMITTLRWWNTLNHKITKVRV